MFLHSRSIQSGPCVWIDARDLVPARQRSGLRGSLRAAGADAHILPMLSHAPPCLQEGWVLLELRLQAKRRKPGGHDSQGRESSACRVGSGEGEKPWERGLRHAREFSSRLRSPEQPLCQVMKLRATLPRPCGMQKSELTSGEV